MLSLMFLKKGYDLNTTLAFYTSSIKSRSERDVVNRLLFTRSKEHNICYMSYDFNWGFPPDTVLSALIKLSRVINALSSLQHTFNDKNSLLLITHVKTLYTSLLNALKVHIYPKKFSNIKLDIDIPTMFDVSKQISSTLLVQSVNVKPIEKRIIP